MPNKKKTGRSFLPEVGGACCVVRKVDQDREPARRPGRHLRVAEADPTKAVDIIRRNIAGPNVELEDLGRVSDKLLVPSLCSQVSLPAHETARSKACAAGGKWAESSQDA
jgi:hypothetical protein